MGATPNITRRDLTIAPQELPKVANPAPLGLAAFGLTTVVLSAINAGLLPREGVALAEPGTAVRVCLEGKEVRYFVESAGSTVPADLPDLPPDQGVYLLLAELAARC